MTHALVLSCEHAGNRVPGRWKPAFESASARRALDSHRGMDFGALVQARELARRFGVPLHACTTTRLLADPNRSEGNRHLFSEWTRALPRQEREAIVERLWRPYRESVQSAVLEHLDAGRRVVHVSVHSFTPELRGEVRRGDVALLYDPATKERRFADLWLAALKARRPDLVLRRNYPYLGVADGCAQSLRRVHSKRGYLGVEIEMNQRFALGPEEAWKGLRADVATALREALARRC